MSCNIKGKVLSIVNEKGRSGVCAKHACAAKVKVFEVSDRGSSMSLSLNEGDTVEMQFAYTLENTKPIFPAMKAHYPGLKKGDVFRARTEQRLKMGAEGEFVVYGYEKVRSLRPVKAAVKANISAH